MKKAKLLLLLLVTVSFFSSGCKKGDDAEARFEKEETLIKEYITANNIPAIRDEKSGLYYQIINPGSGSVTYSASTRVIVKYALRLLGGQVIQQTDKEVELTLGGVITGWQIGIPKIQPGGKIRLFVPSVYAYGTRSQTGIPANSVLDFDIDLVGIVIN